MKSYCLKCRKDSENIKPRVSNTSNGRTTISSKCAICGSKIDQPINNMIKTYENIRKITIGQGDYYATSCLLDYSYFKKYYKMIAVDLSKQQALDADPKAIQQINFTANLDRNGNTRFYFILEEAEETVFEFSHGTVKVL